MFTDKSFRFSLDIVEIMFAYIDRYACQYNSLTTLRLSIVYHNDFELRHVDEYTAYISLLDELNRLDKDRTTDSLLNRDAAVQI